MNADPTESDRDDARKEEANAWQALSLIIAGVAFWGVIGWFIDQWLDSEVFAGLGVVIGAGAAMYLVWIRYGRA